MKIKSLKKKIRRLEKRLQDGQQRLAKLKQRLQTTESAKALKAARKSAARAASKSSKSGKKTSGARKTRKKLNLSPERRAQLAAAMKARWAAKRAAQAQTNSTSGDNQRSAPGTPPPPENRPDGV